MTENRAETGAGAAPAPVCYRHPDRETWVSCTRCSRPVCPDCMRPAAVGFQCPECVREGAKGVRPVRTAFGGRIEGEQGLVTRVLIGINVGVFILTALASALISADNAIAVLAGRSVDSPLYEWFSMVPYRLLWDRDTVVDGVAQGQVWRLFTAGFLHYGIIHLLLNMWALWVLGREVERMVGRWRYLAVYLLSGLGGAVTAYAFGATNAAVAGASGSIFGLFGALFFFFRKLNLDPRGLILIIALNFGLGFVIPSISILGHLGGLVVGAATGALLAYAPRGPNRAFFQITGLVVIGLAVAVVAALRTIQLTAI